LVVKADKEIKRIKLVLRAYIHRIVMGEMFITYPMLDGNNLIVLGLMLSEDMFVMGFDDWVLE
jgi:hypothetical protein